MTIDVEKNTNNSEVNMFLICALFFFNITDFTLVNTPWNARVEVAQRDRTLR